MSSSRSLKRHQTTCKQYIAEHGPPPDSEYVFISLLENGYSVHFVSLSCCEKCCIFRRMTIRDRLRLSGAIKVEFVTSSGSKFRPTSHPSKFQTSTSEPQSPTTTVDDNEPLKELPKLEVAEIQETVTSSSSSLPMSRPSELVTTTTSNLISPSDTVSSGYHSASPQISPDSTNK